MMFNVNFEVFLPYIYNILISIVVIIIAYFASIWIIKGVKKANQRVQKIDPTLLPITLTVIKYAIFIFTILIILNIFGANTNGIIALLGAAGLGLALALKDTLQNIASGIMLIFLRPFKINDYIECSGNNGTVQEINLFTTTLKTADGIFLFVPNNLLWNASIRNYTRNGTRRLDFNVGISYADDINKARDILMDIARLDGRILKEPAPFVVVTTLTDSSVSLMLRCWIDIDNFWDVNYYLHKTVKESFGAAAISIPFPQRDIRLHISNSSSEPKEESVFKTLK